MNALSDMSRSRGIQREKIKSLLELKLVFAGYPEQVIQKLIFFIGQDAKQTVEFCSLQRTCLVDFLCAKDLNQSVHSCKIQSSSFKEVLMERVRKWAAIEGDRDLG